MLYIFKITIVHYKTQPHQSRLTNRLTNEWLQRHQPPMLATNLITVSN